MSAEEVTEDVVALAEDATEMLHDTAENVAEAVRGIHPGWVVAGWALGAATGAFFGYKVAYRKAEERCSAIAAEEIAEMRENYYRKEVARDNEIGKGDLSEIVKERGYRSEETEPPLGMKPPSAVVDRAAELAEDEDEGVSEDDEIVKPATPEEPITRNIFRDNTPPPDDIWDWHEERKRRSPNRPYIIHRDEREDREAYENIVYTYYEEDDVVCNEADEVIDMEDRERIFGEAHLEKFGHGSGDATTVLVRNDELSMDIEICRSPNSYAEEVHGLEPPPEIRHSHYRERRHISDE